MSDDLIKREDAIKAVKSCIEDSWYRISPTDACQNIRCLPSADAPSIDIEPKRGEWVKRTHDTLIAQVNFAYCSECGQPIMHEHTRPLWSFCPNCGADMREREGE